MECNTKTIEELLGYWKVYISVQFPKSWSVLGRLNMLHMMKEQQGTVAEILQHLEDSFFDPGLHQVCQKMLNYDDGLLNGNEFRKLFREFQDMELRRIYRTHEEKLMNRTKQEEFVSKAETMETGYFQIRLIGSLNDVMLQPLILALRTLCDQLKTLYFLDVHKISFSGFGHQQLSYTCMEKDLALQLQQKTSLRYLEHMEKSGMEDLLERHWVNYLILNFCAPLVIMERVIEILNLLKSKAGKPSKIAQVWEQIPFIPHALKNADLSEEEHEDIREQVMNALQAFFLLMEAGVIDEYKLIEEPVRKKNTFWKRILNLR